MDFIDFLIEAKKNTYANGKANQVKSSKDGSRDYKFEKEMDGKKLTYHDTYFGGENFIGEEVVYTNSQKPCWGMNYYGYTVKDSLFEDYIDKVLRPALMRVGQDNKVLPLRGPSIFMDNGYKYTFETTGSIKNFSGIERIYKNNKLIYELYCHGGVIK